MFKEVLSDLVEDLKDGRFHSVVEKIYDMHQFKSTIAVNFLLNYIDNDSFSNDSFIKKSYKESLLSALVDSCDWIDDDD